MRIKNRTSGLCRISVGQAVTGQFSVQTLRLFSVTVIPQMVHILYFIHLPPTLCNIILATDSVIKQNIQGEKGVFVFC
jgi:hypothetical protein